LDVLHKCNSPYIVGFYGAFATGNDISICMEYMNGLSLDIVLQTVGRLEELRIGRIAVAVVRGLTYLKNEFNILHRDVKPSNMLVNSQGDIKLCDFGVSCMLIDSMANSFVGTRSYMAPERLTGARYSIQSDVWSFGLSLVEIAVGRFPIPAPSRSEYARLFNVRPEAVVFDLPLSEIPGVPVVDVDYIVNKEPPSLPRRIFSDEFVDFVGLCLEKELAKRANTTALMASPFFKLHALKFGDGAEFASWVCKVIESRQQSEADEEAMG